MNNNPIGIFDSGLGGLSIYQEIKKTLPEENFIYLADHKNIPYGEKSINEIQNFTIRNLIILKRKNIKLAVVACNTSTVSGINVYRQNFFFPIIGVVPVVKTASEKSKNGIIGILSTITTAKSGYQKNLIKQFCSDKKVINVGSKNLVSFVEKGKLYGKEVTKELKKDLKQILDSKADIIVLGCTHFPFLKKAIKKIVNNAKIIDSGKAVARQVKRILEKEHILGKNKRGKTEFYTTGNSKEVSKSASKILNYNVAFKSA